MLVIFVTRGDCKKFLLIGSIEQFRSVLLLFLIQMSSFFRSFSTRD